MSFLGQMDEVMWNWRYINKMLKKSERITPKEYGEHLQKKCRSKKRRGRKCRHMN